MPIPNASQLCLWLATLGLKKVDPVGEHIHPPNEPYFTVSSDSGGFHLSAYPFVGDVPGGGGAAFQDGTIYFGISDGGRAISVDFYQCHTGHSIFEEGPAVEIAFPTDITELRALFEQFRHAFTHYSQTTG